MRALTTGITFFALLFVLLTDWSGGKGETVDVIGSNSVVTKDLPPGVIAAGAPAKVLREIDFRRDDGGSDS